MDRANLWILYIIRNINSRVKDNYFGPVSRVDYIDDLSQDLWVSAGCVAGRIKHLFTLNNF